MRQVVLSWLVVSFVLTHQSLSYAVEPSSWNQWRGPSRDSQLPTAKWPDKLAGHLELVWERPHSPSYSGPIVNKGIVFTTETIGKKSERVTAYSLTDGEVQWTTEWAGAMAVPFFAAANGDWIRDPRLYRHTLGGSGDA